MNQRFDILIVGAGFAGLAFARVIAAGLGGRAKVGLIDGRMRIGRDWPKEVRSTPRAFAISAASKRMLDRIGVWGAIEADAQPVSGIEITDAPLDAGVRPALLRYPTLLDDSEPASYIAQSVSLERALREIVVSSSGISFVDPGEVREVEAGIATTTLRLKDGRALESSLVVAADGQGSLVRKAAGIKTVGWDYKQRGIVTEVSHERPHEGRAVQHFLPTGPFAILPLKDNRACITWSEDAGEAARVLALDDAGFAEEIKKRFGPRLGEPTVIGERQSWPLKFQLARSFVGIRVALIGDAARVVHPLAGQGLNLGLRDVAALAEVIVDGWRLGLDIGAHERLQRYQQWRRFDSWMSASGFDVLNRLFARDVPLQRSMREFGLGVVDRLPPLKKLLVEEAAGVTGEVPKLMRGESL